MAAGKFEPPDEVDLSKKNADTTDISTSLQSRKGADVSAHLFYAIEGTLLAVSLVTWLVDTLTDILVAFGYYASGHTRWGTLTLVFVLVPSVVVQIFSARWYTADGKMKGCYPWIIHVCLLQPLERYLNVIVTGMRAFRSQDSEEIEAYYHQQNDVCMLRLFEAFLESAPQLVLQLYIMVATSSANWLTGVSAAMSLVALGWAVTAYNHALRKAYKGDYVISWPSLLLQTLWHIAMVASRVAAIVLFTSLYKAWIFLFLAIHWLLMTAWVYLQKTDFSPTWWEERFFNLVVGIIYCFCFFSLKEGQTRYRAAFFYSSVFAEGVIIVGLWYPYRQSNDWYLYALFITVFAAFFFGLCCMLVYYRWCHPSGPMYCCCCRQHHSSQDSLHLHQPPLISTPQLPHKVSTASQLKVELVPKQTSTTFLPRRSLLLKTQSRIHVEFREAATPHQLSPIKTSPTQYDQTFNMADTPGFHHYSVNACDCLDSSRCNTMNYTGLDLSTTSPPTRVQPRRLFRCNVSDPLPNSEKKSIQNRSLGNQLRHAMNESKSSTLKGTLTAVHNDDTKTILPPSSYLGSPDDKIQSQQQELQNLRSPDLRYPAYSPLDNRSPVVSPLGGRSGGPWAQPGVTREMFSTPRVDRYNIHPLAPDFTPIHPSLTPYLKVFRSERAGCDPFPLQLDVENQTAATASLDISQYTFETCDGDQSLYETCDELDEPKPPPKPPRIKYLHSDEIEPPMEPQNPAASNKRLSNHSEYTTDTDYPASTDTEYHTATDTDEYTTTDTGYDSSTKNTLQRHC